MHRLRFFLAALVLTVASVSGYAIDWVVGPKVTIGEYNEAGPDWTTIARPNGWKNGFSPSVSGGGFLNLGFTDLLSLQIEGLLSYRPLRYRNGEDWYTDRFVVFSIPLYGRIDFETGSFGLYIMAGPRIDILFNPVAWRDSDGNEDRFLISEYENLHRFIVALAAAAGMTIPAGRGYVDAGLAAGRSLNRYDSSWKTFIYGIEVQIGYGIRL